MVQILINSLRYPFSSNVKNAEKDSGFVFWENSEDHEKIPIMILNKAEKDGQILIEIDVGTIGVDLDSKSIKQLNAILSQSGIYVLLEKRGIKIRKTDPFGNVIHES